MRKFGQRLNKWWRHCMACSWMYAQANGWKTVGLSWFEKPWRSCDVIAMKRVRIIIYFSDILIESEKFPFRKMRFKMSSEKQRPLISGLSVLTHRGRVTHIFLVGSDNEVTPVRCQAIIWFNDGFLLMEPLGVNLSEFDSKYHNFHSRKWSWKCRPQNDVDFVSASIAEATPHRFSIPDIIHWMRDGTMSLEDRKAKFMCLGQAPSQLRKRSYAQEN